VFSVLHEIWQAETKPYHVPLTIIRPKSKPEVEFQHTDFKCQ